MVTATTNFLLAVLHFQRVVLNDLKFREATKESRRFYREQKVRTLDEFSRYEYLFSDNYRRLQESGPLVTYPDLGQADATQIYVDGLVSGRSYPETYREISQAFDGMLRESTTDPTGSNRLISKYEKELIQIYNDFGAGCLDIIRDNFGNPAETSIQIDKHQVKLMKSVRKMLVKQVPKFWQQGVDWAEISIQQAKKKEEYVKPDIYIDPNQAAIDALIERNLGYVKGMTEDQKKAILSELTEGMIRGEGIDQLVKRLLPYVEAGKGKGQSRAEMIARTEVMYGLNQGALRRYGQDGIEKVQWLAGPDDRMCFPKFITVTTDKGDIRIDEVRIGDLVLTREGFQKVTFNFERSYSGIFTQINTETSTLYCTLDHPIFEMSLGWVEAGKIKPGYRLQAVNNESTKVKSVINFKLPDPYHAPSFRCKKSVLSIIFHIILVPIVAIHLYCDFFFRQSEIDRIPSNGQLLGKFNTHVGKGNPNSLLKAGFSRIFPVTCKRAKLTGITRTFTEFFSAGFTIIKNRGSPALFRTVTFLSRFARVRDGIGFPASLTNIVFCGAGPTFETANNIAISNNRRDFEDFTTNGAGFLNFQAFNGFKITDFGAVFSFWFRSMMFKSVAALGANSLNLHNTCIMITFLRAIFAFIESGLERGAAICTDFIYHLHTLINFIRIAHSMLGINTIYNLAVENNPEFYSNRILVHNCDICGEKNGSVYEIEKAPTLPYHVNCRCTWVPYFDDNSPLDRWMDDHKDAHIEHIAVYDENWNVIGTGEGDSISVSLPCDTKDKIVVHNHPDKSRADFSYKDLEIAFSENQKASWVVSGDGTKIGIERPEKGWPDPSDVIPIYKNASSIYENDFKKVQRDYFNDVISTDEFHKRYNELEYKVYDKMYKDLGLNVIRK